GGPGSMGATLPMIPVSMRSEAPMIRTVSKSGQPFYIFWFCRQLEKRLLLKVGSGIIYFYQKFLVVFNKCVITFGQGIVADAVKENLLLRLLNVVDQFLHQRIILKLRVFLRIGGHAPDGFVGSRIVFVN